VLSATLTPGTLTLTGVAGTTSAAQMATLTNTGNTALSITGITLTGANLSDFAETNTCGSSLAPQQTCTISVTFVPVGAGSLTATLSVADNATGGPQTATLNGTATPAPTFTISSPTGPQTIAAGGSATYTAAAKVGWGLAAPALAALGLFFLPGKRRRRWITMAVLLLTSFGAVTAMTGCGGGFAIPKAPLQTYTVTVTATSGAIQQTTTVTLTVQ